MATIIRTNPTDPLGGIKMRFRIIVALLLAGVAVVWAADKVQPLNVKLGLWEMTTTVNTRGLPPVPPEALARMTPEQRAQMAERMKSRDAGAPNVRSTTRKDCVTKEKLEKAAGFDENRKNCSRTILTSTDRKLEMQTECIEERGKTKRTIEMEAPNPETVTGNIHMVRSGGDTKMEMASNFSGKWIAPVCGDVK
jgi:hypothetical protein